MNTTTAGRCNVYYLSVNASVKLSVKFSVTFHSTHGNGFLSETGSSTVAIFDAFQPTCTVRNQKHTTHLWGPGGVENRHGTYKNWRRKCNNMAVKTEKNSCGIARFPSAARLSCLFIRTRCPSILYSHDWLQQIQGGPN